VLQQRYRTLARRGNLNSEQGLPLTLLRLGGDEERRAGDGHVRPRRDRPAVCAWRARPSAWSPWSGRCIWSRLGTIERIAQAKSELVQALPAADDGGVAILNWDDERVRAMAT
jgi:UDP-N-acetylmuramoyl-tripeptide--D-alanyl-D-alanine ligase